MRVQVEEKVVGKLLFDLHYLLAQVGHLGEGF
jgi:hypothetical protein